MPRPAEALMLLLALAAGVASAPARSADADDGEKLYSTVAEGFRTGSLDATFALFDGDVRAALPAPKSYWIQPVGAL